MKVLTCTTVRRGGVASYFAALQGKFSQEVDYFTVGSRSSGENFAATTYRLLNDNVRFHRVLAQEKYDIIHVNPSFDFKAVVRDGMFLRIARKFPAKRVVFFHGWKTHFEEKLRKHGIELFKRTFFDADAMAVLASEVKQKLMEMGYEKKIHLLTGAVDDRVFSSADEASILKKYEAARRPFAILFLSRIERSKGIYEALEAFRLLRSRRQDVSLIMAGDGSELRALRQKAINDGLVDVEFPGYIDGDRKADHFLRADLFLMPSYTEGMPLAILEAMAFGLPVVTRSVGGIVDFFEDGKMGYATDDFEPMTFVRFIETLMENSELRRRISIFNHRYAKQHFMASTVAKKIESIYQDVLE